MPPAPFLVTGLIIGNDFLFFISLHCPQLFSAPPALPTFRRSWTWLKCTTESIDGARAMVGIRNGVAALIKQVTPDIASIQCVINREALEDKKVGNE